MVFGVKKKLVNSTKSNLTLWLILAICASPFVFSIILFIFWTPKSFVNYGGLLEPRPFKDFFNPQNTVIENLVQDIRGRWSLIIFDQGGCPEECQSKLYWIRQLRLSQGREKDRLERIWFVTDNVSPSPDIVKNFNGTRVINLLQNSLSFQPPDGLVPKENIFLVDTYGNLMMYYPESFEADKIKKDLKKLLKVSKGLRYKNLEY